MSDEERFERMGCLIIVDREEYQIDFIVGWEA